MKYFRMELEANVPFGESGVPPEGGNRPTSIDMVVVLPAPLWPRRTWGASDTEKRKVESKILDTRYTYIHIYVHIHIHIHRHSRREKTT